MAPEYYIEGKFPGSERVLWVGPKKGYFTTLITKNIDDSGWKGFLEIKGKTPGILVIKNDKKGNPFKTEQDLKEYLRRKYHLTYLRDKTQPAIETS